MRSIAAFCVIVSTSLGACSNNKVNVTNTSGYNAKVMRNIVIEDWKCSDRAASNPLLAKNVVVRDVLNCPLHEEVFSATLVGEASIVASQDDLEKISNIYVYIFDASYADYEANLLGISRTGRTVPSILNTILPVLGISGDISGTELGAAGLITALISDVQTGFLEGSTVTALTAKMRKDREATLENINAKLASNKYELPSLMRDLIAYHEAGTLENALRNLNTNVTGDANVKPN